MEQKYLDMADAALSAVRAAAPDIIPDVWNILHEDGVFYEMRENVAQAIKDAEGLP